MPWQRVAGLVVRVLLGICLQAAATANSTHPPTPTSHLELRAEIATVTEEEAVVGGIARLPCDIRPPSRADHVVLVIWYKGSTISPIYSLDVRGRSLQQHPTHWADERTLGGRSFFRVQEEDDEEEEEEEEGERGEQNGRGAIRGTHLAIESVREADAGSYRCRVDFRYSPTRNAIVNLTVIVPPASLTLLDEEGRVVEGTMLGPFSEGASTVITCIAEGGRPLPRVSWLRDGAPLDTHTDNSLAQSVLRVGPLSRADLRSQLQCIASNSPLVPPLRRSVAIDLLSPT